VRAYNHGKPFTGLTPSYGTTPLLKGISTSLAKKLQYDIPIYYGRGMLPYGPIVGIPETWVAWFTTTPEYSRARYEKIGLGEVDRIVEVYLDLDLRGFAIEVDANRPEYEPDAQ